MLGGIYKIESITGNKIYVGQAVNIDKRIKSHKYTLIKNTHINPHLQNHFNKYGMDDFIFSVLEVIDRGENQSVKEYKEILNNREQYYIDTLYTTFNIVKLVVNSSYGTPRREAKNWVWEKTKNTYRVYFTIKGKRIKFNTFHTQEEAENNVAYLKTLSEDDKYQYYLDNVKGYCHRFPRTAEHRENMSTAVRNSDRKVHRGGKWYYKDKGKYKVKYMLEGKIYRLGIYNTEEEAKDVADREKERLGIK
jgi:group I intron endonuclease